MGINKSSNVQGHDNTAQYRQLLVKTMHSCTIKFPEVVSHVIPVLMNFIGDNEELAASDVLVFVREAVHKYTGHKPDLLGKLLEVFPTIKSIKTMRGVLWIL